MTTIALDHADTDVQHDRRDETTPSLTSVANPRRTTWTGYAKNATDRLPSV
ncbi:hypothetical protein [Nocardioides mangrovi]|uniref:Uncharacterized protein n=1 Tax=Nocardioides mangrovi TaxID=2874580 RepID=A0ABS7UCY4_9ACTN|nr:hypothetical protein [Nocardioides mangrovi]MBZ5738863.1 hypothetical protein [Nocardioides mangrovi]